MPSNAMLAQGSALVEDVRDSSGRMSPQAVDVEEYILGAMLIYPEAVSISAALLDKKNAFYLPKHHKIYKAILALFEAGQPVDPITTMQQLTSSKELDQVGGLPYLRYLSERSVTSANTEYHARIIVQKALLRQMIAVMNRSISQAYDPATDAFELLDKAETDLFNISDNHIRSSTRDLTDILHDTIDHILNIGDNRSGEISGVTSGFKDLDQLTGGWQDSDLIIIAGRPSMGKCVDADTPILLSNGQLIRIADLYERQNAHLLTLGKDQQFCVTEPSAYIYDGLKPVFQVTTRLGRSVQTTLTHPFLTPSGWQPLGELSTGTLLAVPSELPIFGSLQVSKSQVHQLVNLVRHPQQALRPMPGTHGTIVKSQGLQVLPNWVFSLSPHQLKDFLKQLFEGKRSLLVTSRLLAQQVAHLYLRFGVLMSVSKRLNGWIVHPSILSASMPSSDTSGQIVFDEIVQIESVGVRPVYDLTIDETHNFVASDVCVHNTAFALSCARNAAMHQPKPVSCAIFSMEMSARQLSQRLLTSEARVNAQAARTGNLSETDFEALRNAADKLHSTKIFVDDTAGLDILELRAKCRRLKSEKDIGLVLIDYLQLMQGRSSDKINREQEIARISRSLKALAKELEIPVIALSQLNRNAEDRKDKRPLLADLRESGAIEQDADLVAFIYRASYYGIPVDENKESTEGMAEIIVGKHRNGPVGTVKIQFLKDYACFANRARYEAPPEAFSL